MQKMIYTTLLFLVPAVMFAQFKTNNRATDIADQLKQIAAPQSGLVSILGLDPSKLHISNSYEMSYMSFGGKGYSQGLYLNTLSYQFSAPLSMSFQWGIANQPVPGLPTSPLLNNGFFVSGAQVKYQPTKNLSIQLDYRNRPTYSYYDPYFSDRW
jgi:hypothetical protein